MRPLAPILITLPIVSKSIPFVERSILNSLLFISEAVCQFKITCPLLHSPSKRVSSMGRIIKLVQFPVKDGIVGLANVYGEDIFDPAPNAHGPDPE